MVAGGQSLAAEFPNGEKTNDAEQGHMQDLSRFIYRHVSSLE